MKEIDRILKEAFEKGASDIIICAGSKPAYRVTGSLVQSGFGIMEKNDCKTLLYSILTDDQIRQFEKELDIDLSYESENISRYRVNIHMQMESIAAAFRPIPVKIPSIAELKLPQIVADLASEKRGLILVTGPTGHGKTTTQASMIDVINSTRKSHVITVEDPIEYLHKSKLSIIEQREIGIDTSSFNSALKHVLRQNPDVILIGEMRDIESVATAITAAETGHLVISTLHTGNTIQAIDRIIDVFPPYQQQQIRTQLSLSLAGIVAQQLIPTSDGSGLIVAVEIMIATSGIRNLIRKGNSAELYSMIEIGAKYGMISMDSSIADLYKRKIISHENAILHAINPENLEKILTK